MKSTNNNYTINVKSNSKKPRATIVVSFDDNDTDLVCFTSHPDGVGPGGELVLTDLIEDGSINNQTQKIDMLKSTSTIGKLSFNIIDLGGIVSDLIGAKEAAGSGLRFKRVQIYSGFKGDTWTDYELDSTHIIEDSHQEERLIKFSCTDVARLTRTKIFNPKIQNLRGSISAIEKTFSINTASFLTSGNIVNITKTSDYSALDFEPGKSIDILGTVSNNGTYTVDVILSDEQLSVIEPVTDETVIGTASHVFRILLTGTDLTKYQPVQHDSSYSANPNDTVAYVRIDEEIMIHDGPVNDLVYGYCIPVREDGRGELGSPTTKHEINSGNESDSQPEVTEIIVLEGAAPKLAVALLTGTLYGQTGSLPDNWNCGVPAKFIRTADFVNIGLDLWNPNTDEGRHLQFIEDSEFSGKDFIEKQLMLWMGAFMVIHTDGSLGIKKIPTMNSLTGYVAEINDAVSYTRSTLKRDMKKLLNQIIIKWGKVKLKNEFTKSTVLEDFTSIGTHKVNSPRVFEFRGVTLGVNTDEDLRSYLSTWRDLYSAPPYEYTTTVAYKLMQIEVGDAVRVSLPNHKDIIKQQPFDRVMLVTSVSYNPITGDMKLSLISPSNYPTPLLPVNSSVKMNPAFYTPASPARELGQAVIDGGGTIVAGVITSDATLTGSPDMNSLSSVFYYNGDLRLQDGINLFLFDNCFLRINGFFTEDGNVISIGSSNNPAPAQLGVNTVSSVVVTPGTPDSYDVVTDTPVVFLVGDKLEDQNFYDTPKTVTAILGSNSFRVSSVASLLGSTTFYLSGPVFTGGWTGVLDTTILDSIESRFDVRGDSGFGISKGEPGYSVFYRESTTNINGGSYFVEAKDNPQIITNYAPDGVGAFSRNLNLVNLGDSIGGLPNKFTGTAGTSGGVVIDSVSLPPLVGRSFSFAAANGGLGGQGGAGLLVVCKGASFGPNASIDLTGAAGVAGSAFNTRIGYQPDRFIDLQGGSGTGGNPGATYFLYDGEYTPPNLEGRVISQIGVTPIVGLPINPEGRVIVSDGYILKGSVAGSREFIYDTEDARFQYLPSNLAPIGDVPKYASRPLAISLTEVRNSPPSADGNLSTIEIIVTEPSDTSYGYANVYIRKQGVSEWTFVGPAAGSSVKIVQTVSSDGQTWEFVARAVSLVGNEDSTGIMGSITVFNFVSILPTDPQLPVILPLNTPQNLSLLGGGGLTFTGKSCQIEWDYDGANGPEPQHFLNYLVEVYNTTGADTLQRSFPTTEQWFEYTEQMAVEDGGPYRNLRFDISAVARQGHASSIATISVTNPQAGTLLGVTLSTIFQALTMDYTVPNEPDLAGVLVYINDVSGFTPDSNTLIYDGANTSLYFPSYKTATGVANPLVTGTTYYIRYGLYDSFGKTGINLSSEQSFVVSGGISTSDVSGLSNWATRTTPADAAFIASNIGNNAITTTQIASIVASKIQTGTLAATLTVSGLIQTASSGWRVDVGPVVLGPTTYVLRYHDGAGNSKFAIDSLGNVLIDSTVTIGSTIVSTLETNAASGATFPNSNLEGNVLTVQKPIGGSFSSSLPSNIGAIVIELPVSWTNSIMKMEIDVFVYQTSGGNGKSFTAKVGGYNYITSTQWINEFAQIIGNTSNDNRIRFGHNGTNCVIVIGSDTADWPYIKVVVRGLQVSHTNFTKLLWESGWVVSIQSDTTTGYVYTGDFSDALLDAKSITNQGTLATSNSADWNTQLSNYPGNTAVLNTNTTKTDVGLANVDNQSAATIQAGTTASNVGLSAVSNLAPASMTQSGLNTGTIITGGGIQLNSGGALRSFGKSYGSGDGVFLGWDAGAYKLDLTGATHSVRFDGTTLDITGNLTASNFRTATSGSRVEINYQSSNEVRVFGPTGGAVGTVGLTGGSDGAVIQAYASTTYHGLSGIQANNNSAKAGVYGYSANAAFNVGMVGVYGLAVGGSGVHAKSTYGVPLRLTTDNGSPSGKCLAHISFGSELDYGLSSNIPGYLRRTQQGLQYGATTATRLMTYNHAQISEVVGNNVQGGTATAGSWIKRRLNTIVSDGFEATFIDQVGVGSPEDFMLEVGTYIIKVSSPVYAVDSVRLRLYNISNGNTVILGETAYANSGYSLTLSGMFTVTSRTAHAIYYRSQSSRIGTGLGVAANFGENEVYTVVDLWKIA